MRKHWVLIASGKACSIEGPWRDWFIPFVGRGYSVGAETSWNHEASRSSFMDNFLMDFLWLLYGCFQHLSAVAFSCQQSSAVHGWGAEIPLDAKTMHSTVPLQFLHLVVMATLVVNGGDDHLMVAICGNGIAKSLHGSFCQDCSSTAYKMVKGFQPHRMASIICGCRMYISIQ